MDDLEAQIEREGRCDARTRRGEPCKRRGTGAGGRCPNHGGMSTGPRTKAGRKRVAQAQQRRWAEYWRAIETAADGAPGDDETKH